MIRGSEFTNCETLNRRTILIGLSTVLIGLSTVLIGTWIALASGLPASPATPKWVLKADYIDACCCDLACPCLFGGSPTHGYCKEGYYGQVDLAGVTALAVYNSGKWIKFFVSETATKEQTDAVVEFLPVAEGFFNAPVRDVRNLPISVKRTKDKVKIKTEGILIELEQIRNADGEPIKVLGLPAQGFPGLPYLNHTQYKTVALTHDSEKEKFKFSGTNGFTARIDASSDPEASRSESNGTSISSKSR
jgi:hypothetical protein